MKNYCKSCNASHENTVERVLRCMSCVARVAKPPTNYKPIKAAHGIKGEA
jgi:hypothetical protein